MPFAVYGRRTIGVRDVTTGKIVGPDKQFAPLNEYAIRTSKAKLTNVFAEKSDAQEWIDKHNFKDGVVVEIRRV